MSKKTLGNLLLILTAMIWGTAFVGQRVGMESIEPFTFTAARMALAAVAVGTVAIILTGRRAGTAEGEKMDAAYMRNTFIGGVCCGVFLTAGSLFQQVGVVYTSAGKAGFITAMYMLLVPVINFLFFRKRNSLRVWLAVFIGIVGMYILCVREGFSLTRGDMLVFICAFMFSGHILCCDYFAPRGDAIMISAIQFAVTSLISAVFALAFEEPDWAKIVSAAIPILYCGIISGGVGYTLQIVAQKYTDPTIASLLMSLESVFAVIAGALLLGERMSPQELVGCVVMFAAIVLVQLPEKKESL